MIVFGTVHESAFHSVADHKRFEILDNFMLMQKYIETPEVGPFLWNKIYRADLWKNIKLPEVPMCEDSMIIHEVLGRTKKCVILEKNLYVYVQRSGSTERSCFSKSDFFQLEWSSRLLGYISKNYPQIELSAYQTRLYSIVKPMYKILYYFTYRQNRDDYQKFYTLLQETYMEAVNKYPLNHLMEKQAEESYLKDYYIQALTHPKWFAVTATYSGLKGLIIRKIMKVIRR